MLSGLDAFREIFEPNQRFPRPPERIVNAVRRRIRDVAERAEPQV